MVIVDLASRISSAAREILDVVLRSTEHCHDASSSAYKLQTRRTASAPRYCPSGSSTLERGMAACLNASGPPTSDVASGFVTSTRDASPLAQKVRRKAQSRQPCGESHAQEKKSAKKYKRGVTPLLLAVRSLTETISRRDLSAQAANVPSSRGEARVRRSSAYSRQAMCEVTAAGDQPLRPPSNGPERLPQWAQAATSVLAVRHETRHARLNCVPFRFRKRFPVQTKTRENRSSTGWACPRLNSPPRGRRAGQPVLGWPGRRPPGRDARVLIIYSGMASLPIATHAFR